MQYLRLTLGGLTLAVSIMTANAQTGQRSWIHPNGMRTKAAEPQWQTAPVTGPNLHYQTFDSKTAGTKVSYLVYLPPTYEQSPAKRFPVVFWLHGIGGSQQGVPRFCERLTAAITRKKAPPMIVVFVNGMIDSFYCDAIQVRRPVETVIIQELIPHIDATYRTCATRAGRMMEGFSMGGFGAGHLGFKYPELFGSVSMMDAALVDIHVMQGRHADVFRRVFDGKEALFAAAHPLDLVAKNKAQIQGNMLIRQVVGQLVGPNATFHEELVRLNIAHEYTPIEGIGHNMLGLYEKLGDKNWFFYTQAFRLTQP